MGDVLCFAERVEMHAGDGLRRCEAAVLAVFCLKSSFCCLGLVDCT